MGSRVQTLEELEPHMWVQKSGLIKLSSLGPLGAMIGIDNRDFCDPLMGVVFILLKDKHCHKSGEDSWGRWMVRWLCQHGYYMQS